MHTFTAATVEIDPSAWLEFIDAPKRKNRSRLMMFSLLHCRGVQVGELEGDFVASRWMPGGTR